MPRSVTARRSRWTTALVVLGLPIALLLMPTTWTGTLISLTQVIVPFQSATTAAIDAVESVGGRSGEQIPLESFEQLKLEKAALLHKTAALAVRVDELEREVEILSATRLWDAGGRRLGAEGRLIPAGVVVADLLPWRSSRLVSAGSLQGVRRGSAVVSRYFTIDRGGETGVRDGMAVLLGETLVGLVAQVGTHTSRVKLLGDITVEMKVRVGRFTDDGFVPLDRYFWLKGRGQETMEIRDAERRDVDAGIVQVGDVVLSDPSSDLLPAAMTIGRITAIKPDHDNPLLSILTVQSPIASTDLRRVYLYDPPEDSVDAEPIAGF